MSKTLYTKAFLKNTLAELGDVAKDLSAWDAYNGSPLDELLVKLNDVRFLLEKRVEEVKP